jgi:cell wall-associated NlpC family hydrolase
MSLDRALYGDLIGTPFAYGGRRAGESLDCYGLVMEVAKRRGVELPDPRSPTEQARIAAVVSNQVACHWKPCERKPGAVLVFRIGRLGSHCGVVIDEGRFIHSWEGSKSVVIESIDEWEKRIMGCYEYVGAA